MPVIYYKTNTGKLKEWDVSEEKHKLWRKYKRTLAIREPCKYVKISLFKAYFRKHASR